MSLTSETIVDVFPGRDAHDRLVIACQQNDGDQESQFVLRQESYSSDVGWFVQSRMTIQREQMAGLKMALTAGGLLGQTSRKSPRPARHQDSPQILRFDPQVA